MPYEFSLFSVNDIDFTPEVIQRSYSMQEDDVYQAWTDGDWNEHRNVVRTVVSGSFNMAFLSESRYEQFRTALEEVKTSGYYPVKLYVNTNKDMKSINAFLKVTTNHIWTIEAFGQTPSITMVGVKVTER